MTLDVTFTDLFCGVGGSTSGAMDAGFIGKLGVNHWERAIVCLIQEKIREIKCQILHFLLEDSSYTPIKFQNDHSKEPV